MIGPLQVSISSDICTSAIMQLFAITIKLMLSQDHMLLQFSSTKSDIMFLFSHHNTLFKVHKNQKVGRIKTVNSRHQFFIKQKYCEVIQNPFPLLFSLLNLTGNISTVFSIIKGTSESLKVLISL
jgi:hypothetical protein